MADIEAVSKSGEYRGNFRTHAGYGYRERGMKVQYSELRLGQLRRDKFEPAHMHSICMRL